MFISGFHSRGGKHIAANFKGGAGNTNLGGYSPYITYREGQFPRGDKREGGWGEHPLNNPGVTRLLYGQ